MRSRPSPSFRRCTTSTWSVSPTGSRKTTCTRTRRIPCTSTFGRGRTYTLQEALNLYEQERHQLWVRLSMEEQARETRIHNAIVEDMMDKQLYEQRRANVLLSGILVATTATAVAASAPRHHYHYHY